MALFANIIACMGGITIFAFSCLLRKGGKFQMWEKFFIIFIIIQNFILNLKPGLTIVDVVIMESGKFKMIQGGFTPFFFAMAFVITVLTLKNFLQIKKEGAKIQKIKISYMLTGIFIMMISFLIFLIILPIAFNNYNYAWLPPVFTLAEIALFGYALLTIRFPGAAHLTQQSLAHCANVLVYFIPLFLIVKSSGNGAGATDQIMYLFIASGSALYIFGGKSFNFFDRLFSYILYQDPKNRVKQIEDAIKTPANSPEDWLANLSNTLQLQGAEFAYAGEDSFNSFSDYFNGDYSECIIKQELDYKIAECADGNSERVKLASLKKSMESGTVSLLAPIVDYKGQPAGIIVLKDKNKGERFLREELAGLRVMPDHAIRILPEKDNDKQIMNRDILSGLDVKMFPAHAALDTLRSLIPDRAKRPADIRNYFALAETSLNEIIILFKKFIEAVKCKAHLIEAEKRGVKISELFNATIKEVSEEFTDIEKIISLDISDNIKNKRFLLDENLLSYGFGELIINSVIFNLSEKKELKIKAFLKEDTLIFDFEDNGIGIKRENFKKIFEPMISFSSEKIDAAFNAEVGLTYARGVVSAHNGVILVLKSKPQKTIIRVALPIADETE